MTGILEMFDALSGADRYEYQLSIWCYLQRSASAERSKDWRAANREHVRAYDAARRPPKPRRVVAENECHSCMRPAAPGKKSCETHLAADRARAARRAAKAIEHRRTHAA